MATITNPVTSGQVGAISALQFDTHQEALAETLENNLPVSGDHLTRVLGSFTGHTVSVPSFTIWALPGAMAELPAAE